MIQLPCELLKKQRE